MKAFLILLLLLQAYSGTDYVAAQESTQSMRIVFLGDSITDGHTYPLMVQEALRLAGRPAPKVINAGIGGDTAQGMSTRLERDVLPRKPDLVVLSAGINDAIRKVTLAEYSGYITSIADRLKQEKIPLMVLTTSVYGAKYAEAEARTDEYNAWLRGFAKERDLKVAEVNELFKRVRDERGEAFVIEPDAVHPNWEGQRLIARAVLDALGYNDIQVPEKLQPLLLPGVLTPWKIRVAPGDKAIEADAASWLMESVIAPKRFDDSWKEYSLPETQPQQHPWYEQERLRGFALSLDAVVGKAKRFQGAAFIENESGAPRRVYFNTGAQLQSVWLNGQRIYQHNSWHGWHAGRDRIAATLQPGTNHVFIEAAPQFFLSVTEDNLW